MDGAQDLPTRDIGLENRFSRGTPLPN